VTGIYSHFISSSQGGNGGGNGNETGGGMPSGMSVGSMPSGTIGSPPTGTAMGGGPSGGSSANSADAGGGDESYGATEPEDSSTFLRGWQYTDENGTSLCLLSDSRDCEDRNGLSWLVCRSSIAYPCQCIHSQNHQCEWHLRI
jgi:hypothetical protein